MPNEQPLWLLIFYAISAVAPMKNYAQTLSSEPVQMQVKMTIKISKNIELSETLWYNDIKSVS